MMLQWRGEQKRTLVVLKLQQGPHTTLLCIRIHCVHCEGTKKENSFCQCMLTQVDYTNTNGSWVKIEVFFLNWRIKSFGMILFVHQFYWDKMFDSHLVLLSFTPRPGNQSSKMAKTADVRLHVEKILFRLLFWLEILQKTPRILKKKIR